MQFSQQSQTRELLETGVSERPFLLSPLSSGRENEAGVKELEPWLCAGLSLQVGRVVDGAVGVKLVRIWGRGEMLRVFMLQKGTSVFLLAHTRISFPAQVV